MRFRDLGWVALGAALLSPARARAFAEPAQFTAFVPHAATYGPSGEGVYFTGAPRFSSLTCASCHAQGPGRVGLHLGADDPSLFTAGYRPGATYRLQVELTNARLGESFAGATCTDSPGPNDSFTFVPCNNNGFALEIDQYGVPLSGRFCAVPPVNGKCPDPGPLDQVFVAPGGDAVFANRPRSTDPTKPQVILRNNPLWWNLWWTAPPAGSGPLTVYVAAVDGNGGDGSVENDQDPYNDDTVQAHFFLQERGAPVLPDVRAGCSVAPHAPALPWLFCLMVLGLWRRKLRQGR